MLRRLLSKLRKLYLPYKHCLMIKFQGQPDLPRSSLWLLGQLLWKNLSPMCGPSSYFGFMPPGINSTILSLIPKTEEVHTMKDYRPIACCNLLYMAISKFMALHLKTILPEAIESNQSAFIKERLLLENVLLASELENGYHRTTNSNRVAIKSISPKCSERLSGH